MKTLEQLHQLMQIFLLFCTKKLLFYFILFYFTHLFLQNTHISLFILHIYSIKYSFFYNFFIIFSPSLLLSHRSNLKPISLPTSLSLSHQPNNNYNPPFHNKIATKHPNDAMEQILGFF